MYTKLYPVAFGTIYMYVYGKNITKNKSIQNIQTIQTIQSKWIYLRR